MYLVDIVDGANSIASVSFVVDRPKEEIENLLRQSGFRPKTTWSGIKDNFRDVWHKPKVRGVSSGRRVNITQVSDLFAELKSELQK